jgi:hypothetical protein
MGKEVLTQQETQQEIQDYLEGLNRTHRSWAMTSESERAKAIGIANYVKWFKERNIHIYEDPRTHVWKLGSPP